MSPMMVSKDIGQHGWIGGGGWSRPNNCVEEHFCFCKFLKFNSLPPSVPVVTSSLLSPIAMMLIKSEIEKLAASTQNNSNQQEMPKIYSSEELQKWGKTKVYIQLGKMT